jgi:hypothetical protein
MYVNKCIKCGREFETKNPKRVICPDCLYPDKNMMVSSSTTDSEKPETTQEEPLNGYSAGGNDDAPRYYSAGGNDDQPRYNNNRNNRNSYGQSSGYNRNNGYNNNRQGGYNNNRQQNGYNRNNYNQGGYNNNRSNGYNNNRQGGYQNRPQQGGYNRNNNYNNRRSQQGGFNRNGYNNRRPMQRKAPKQLLVSKEQLDQIELLYKLMLPLPNPDCHEVIGEKIGLEPRKVFFGINLVRQKMMLPKLPFPKRKLAISPDQLFAIKNLYEPLLPLPPIGCHKIIAAQLKMDEWRVHVGIGLIRSQMGLGRWNEDRPDKPADCVRETTPVAEVASVEETAPVEEVKPKRGRKKKTEETAE